MFANWCARHPGDAGGDAALRRGAIWLPIVDTFRALDFGTREK